MLSPPTHTFARAIAATSDAPKVGSKRRLSTTEEEEADTSMKRAKIGTDYEDDDASSTAESPTVVVPASKETAEVKEVTKGVKDVDLDELKAPSDENLKDDVEDTATITADVPSEPVEMTKDTTSSTRSSKDAEHATSAVSTSRIVDDAALTTTVDTAADTANAPSADVSEVTEPSAAAGSLAETTP